MPDLKEKTISWEVIETAMTYEIYRELIDKLLEESKVTGHVQSESLIEYTKLNVHRMNRLDKHTIVPESVQEALSNLDREMIWLVITEGWCGDAAQTIPVISKIASLSEKVTLKIILRDDNSEIMDQYLTNGTRSIPIVLGLDSITLEELFVWGPKPAPAMKILNELKIDSSVTPKERMHVIQLWYSRDRSVTIFKEFQNILRGTVQ
jgi:hypothetical protein